MNLIHSDPDIPIGTLMAIIIILIAINLHRNHGIWNRPVHMNKVTKVAQVATQRWFPKGVATTYVGI
ncbi:hypothetical protein NQ317_013202 [Molorchus minor]|uniref:Uncharacterized protein n=1 Tax=Molorchus minor TaxID=1323400 RepID=A0ABQ9JYJ8_9CUCU|nr:hypothetical protein NQ317_013202 [Molorchus minor]